MNTSTVEHVAALKAIARSSSALMAALQASGSLGLASWCVGAGAVRNLVWDHLHGRVPSAIAEVDLVYFDANEPLEGERVVQDRLQREHPRFTWDVTNQAYVHLWYERVFGTPVSPLRSLAEGVASWPEFATCVGLFLNVGGELEVIAPHGLADLFALRVRHNPARASSSVFAARHASKRWAQLWPRLEVTTEQHAV